MIIAEHIYKRFGDSLAVKDISFEVQEGETLVLLGTSGCGKTTTLRMMNRLIEPTSGTIFINRKSIFAQPPEILRRGIGYVMQNNGLFPHYTVEENIALVPKLLKWSPQKIRQRIKELMMKLQLSEAYLTAYPDQLSGGQQQRVSLARGLAANPPIVLMDEPFGALDPITRVSVRNELSKLDELQGKTIMLVTHDVQEAFQLGNCICLMDKGTILQMGTPAELLFRPQSGFVQHFFDAQRLQLELQTVHLNDVWEHLKVPSKEYNNVGNMYSHQSLWEVMEAASESKNNDTAVDIINKEKGEVKSLLFSEIIPMLNQFKQER